MNKIDRANVNSPKVSASDFPKSGFDLTYKHYRDFVLGHLIPAGYQYIMPADKFQGSNDAKYTFNTLVVPEISDVQVSQHNFYVPFRAIDSTFQRAMVPDELNGMSSSWRTPSFSLLSIIQIIASISGDNTDSLSDIVVSDFSHDPSSYQATSAQISSYKTNWLGVCNVLRTSFAKVYAQDIVDQIEELGMSYLNQIVVGTEYKDALYLVLHSWLDPFIGRNSLLDTLGYLYLRDFDIKRIVSELFDYLAADDQRTIDFNSLLGMVSNIPLCEYAIRAYYAIWYEHYRDPYLEKRSSLLPDWHDFGSTSIFSSTIDLHYLCPRIRSWQKDMFVGSMPDDICRHVYAPIINVAGSVPVLSNEYQYLNTETDDISSGPIEGGQSFVNSTYYSLWYQDSITGQQQNILCPLPKAVNDSLSTLSASTSSLDSFALDLRDLRKSQMLERYLKRNFYFGDEYQDRMLAHYGSKVSDNSIRRPHLLSSSVSTLNPVQEVANMTNEVTKAGTRIATAQDNASGDAYEFFAEEFGIVINMISVIPKAQYAGICPQNLLSQQTDFPIPEFANNNDEFGRNLEIGISPIVGLQQNQTDNPGIFQFGHYPYAHAWRSRVDEVHGSFLDTRQDYTFRRFFGSDSADTTPHLNSSFIHCVPNLGMFEDTVRLNGQGYMTIDHHFFVERVLPTPVEEI